MSAYVDEPSIIQLTLYLDVRSRVIPKKKNQPNYEPYILLEEMKDIHARTSQSDFSQVKMAMIDE